MNRAPLFRTLLAAAGLLAFAGAGYAQAVHPVVDLRENCILGGVSGGKWIDAEKLSPMIKGGERYRLYTLAGPAGEKVGGKPESIGEPCEEVFTVKMREEPEDKIALAGAWNAMPRVPRQTSTNDPIYRQVIAGILRRHGITRPKINILQVLRVDLEGDGKEEVLVSATHLAGGLETPERGMAWRAQPGDYSVVFLRKIVGARVRDMILTEWYHTRENEETGPPTYHKVAGVLDLNGDGKMEIILRGQYYEGSWSTAFRMQGLKPVDVFGCGCGV